MTGDAEASGQHDGTFGEFERTIEAEGEKDGGGFDWIKSMPVALSVAGIVLYGVITIADERFYEALGITGSDVGLSYANTLARASGLVIKFGVIIAILVLLFVWPRRSRSFQSHDVLEMANEYTDKDDPQFRKMMVEIRLQLEERRNIQRAVNAERIFLAACSCFCC